MIIYDRNLKALPFKLSGGKNSGPEAVKVIIQLAHYFKKNSVIRNTAVMLVGDNASMDYVGEMKSLYEFVRDRIRYVRDIRGCETLQIPLVTMPNYMSEIGIGAGDCDDHTILLASLLLAIGVRDLYARIVRYRSASPEWAHIYLVAKYKGKEYVMDAINKKQVFGWEPEYYEKKDIKI